MMVNRFYINKEDAELFELARKAVAEAEANAAANPSSKKIKVVIVEPGRFPYKKLIDNSLDSFQAIVSGYIENLFIGRTKKDARVGIVLNEEGKLIGLPFNRTIFNKRNGANDWLAGTVFITAYNGEGDNVSLTDAECDDYIRKFSSLDIYF